MITSRVKTLKKMEDAWTEYGLPKIWVKLAHASMADTRLSSPPPRTLLEGSGTRLLEPYYSRIIVISIYILA